jgi:hypothetical protein
VYYTSPITQVITPGQGTVTSDSFGVITNFTTTGNTTLGDATTDTLTVGVTGIVKDASGNVGIGTASPSSYGKLVSLGSDNATLFAAVGATNMLRVQGYNSTYVGTLLESVNLAQSANTPLFINGSTIRFGISGTTQTTIDSSGNVGIGISPSSKLQVNGGILATGDLTSPTGAGVSLAYDGTVNKLETWSSTPLAIRTAGVERMRITSGGVLMLGNTTFTNAGLDAGSAYINSNLFIGNSAGTAGYNVRLDGFTDRMYVAWNSGTADINSIYYAYGGTAWVNTSDETLKDIIEPITDAANKVSTLRAVIGKLKTEEEGVRHPFLIAQDVQAVLPEAVYVNKGRKEGEPDTLGIGYTDVIPLLVAAIKEQQALITSLTTRLTVLENR